MEEEAAPAGRPRSACFVLPCAFVLVPGRRGPWVPPLRGPVGLGSAFQFQSVLAGVSALRGAEVGGIRVCGALSVSRAGLLVPSPSLVISLTLRPAWGFRGMAGSLLGTREVETQKG